MAVMGICSHKLYYSVIFHGVRKEIFRFKYDIEVLDTSYSVKNGEYIK